MCDPATLGLAAISGIQSMSSISSQNKASAANTANALEANNNETEQTTAQYIEQQRSLLQGGFDAILKGRANESTAYTSAIQSGVQGASIKALLRDQKQKTARSAVRTGQEMTSLQNRTGASYEHIAAKTQGRINSVAPTGFTIGDAAGILAPIVKSQMD